MRKQSYNKEVLAVFTEQEAAIVQAAMLYTWNCIAPDCAEFDPDISSDDAVELVCDADRMHTFNVDDEAGYKLVNAAFKNARGTAAHTAVWKALRNLVSLGY